MAPVLTLASPTATVAVGATVIPAAGCTVVDGDADLLSGIIEYNPAFLTFSSIPAGWSQDSPGVYVTDAPIPAAQMQADFRAAGFTGAAITAGKDVRFSVFDGVDTAEDAVSVSVTAAVIRAPYFYE